jgi:hypothetical protein
LLRGFDRPERTGDDDEESDVSEMPMDFNSLKEALEALADADEEGYDGDFADEFLAEDSIDESSDWYPFERKEVSTPSECTRLAKSDV